MVRAHPVIKDEVAGSSPAESHSYAAPFAALDLCRLWPISEKGSNLILDRWKHPLLGHSPRMYMSRIALWILPFICAGLCISDRTFDIAVQRQAILRLDRCLHKVL